jgi:hypothetical protein
MSKSLREQILSGQNGLVFYSLTPPKVTTDPERVPVIAANQLARLKDVAIDGLILYDIQDESMRNENDRPFSFIHTIAPEVYSRTYFSDLAAPRIIYKSIAGKTKQDFRNWLSENQDVAYSVFVGASSSKQVEMTGFSLTDAYALRQEEFTNLLLGGVTIPERHTRKGNEHERLFGKTAQGCSFFVSQCVYNINDSKNLLSDYYYTAQTQEKPLVPIIFTLAPCGSLKTLQFMEWLGIEVPKWLYNDLCHSEDILQASVNSCINIAQELANYAHHKQVPIGFNVESVSIKKDEIDAAQHILQEVLKLMK